MKKMRPKQSATTHFARTMLLVMVVLLAYADERQLLFYSHHGISSTVQNLSGNTYCGVAPYPEAITLEQPDGHQFQAYLFTIGTIAYLETLDGYTILQDANDFYYRYATRGTKGDLFLTGVPVSAISDRTSTELVLLQVIKAHLRYEGRALSELEANYQLKSNDDGDTISAVFPPAGVQKALLLLIDFPDQLFTYPNSDFDNLANQVGYNVNGNSGSFRDYYLDISYGLLTVNTDVEGWYTAIDNRAIYGVEDMANRNFDNAVPLIREAVDAAEAAGIDFSQYDGDGDGNVDVVEIIHSGRGAEESGNVADIWSHRWVLSSNGLSVTYDGKLIDDYIIQPEKFGSTNITNIGVFVHEFGHALGLPDLYDIDGSSRGIGRWCCMAGGTWNNSGKTPAHFSAWCKAELGWMNPTVVSGAGSVIDMQHSDISDEAYRINTPDSDEYFLIENRQKTGWDTYIPGEGLAIYHIDESRTTNANENQPLVDLEQADGNQDLNTNSNSGDNGDLFPGSSNNATFDCSTGPSSDNYNGSDSNVSIFDVEEDGMLLDFSYDFCSTDCTISEITRSGNYTNFGGGTYDQNFIITYDFPPASGSLDISAAGVILNAAITASPQTITLTDLPANGLPVTVSASFSAEVACENSAVDLYEAPTDCLNDNVCSATDITANISGVPVICNNESATAELNEPAPNDVGCAVQNGWCENDLDHTVWFKFTAPASGSIDIDFNTAIDLQMALWEADSCAALLESNTRMLVAANDDSGSAGGWSPRLSNISCLIPGKIYYLQVDGYNGTTGNFSMTITDPLISCNVAPTATGGCGTSFAATSGGNGEWLHITDGNGRKIASINDMFNDLGSINLEYAINEGVIRHDGDSYPLLNRDWLISVGNNAAATIRVYVTDQELQDLIAATGSISLADVNLLKFSGGSCSDYNTGTAEVLSPSFSLEDFSGSDHILEYKITGFSSFFGRPNSSFLPVELLYFTGKVQEKSNLLLWASSLEQNTKWHEVERLISAEGEWEVIGQIPASGHSQQEVAYQWVDHYPYPKAYYRLKTVDLDGSSEYSDIVLLERENTEITLSRTFPNPTRETLFTELYCETEGSLSWTIQSASGQMVQTASQRIEAGHTLLDIECHDLPAGLYFIRYQFGDWLETRKLIVE